MGISGENRGKRHETILTAVKICFKCPYFQNRLGHFDNSAMIRHRFRRTLI